MDGGTTMRAAVLQRGGAISVEARPVPELGEGDVLIEVSHCGVCGTDLHEVLDGWGKPGTIGGHEYSGRIAAVGSGVTGWEVGDAVVGGAAPACGTCGPCRSGRPSVCDDRSFAPGITAYQGAFAELVRVQADRLVAVPDGLPLRVAALAEPLAVAMHAITVSGIAPGQSAMVFGAGPIGALIAAVLGARGDHDLTVVEPSPLRQDLARRLGATRLVHPDDLVVPSIAEPMEIVDGAVHVVYECSGHRGAMEAGLAQLRRTGTLVFVGSGMDPPHIDANRVLLNELVITGAFTYDPDGFAAALALLASGALPVDELIHPVDVGLDGLRDAIGSLRAGEIGGKVMIVPTEESNR